LRQTGPVTAPTGHIVAPGPVITHDGSQQVTNAAFGSGEEGSLMGQDRTGSRVAPGDATPGARRSAGRSGPAAQPYEVRPVGWVESPLKHRAQAPNHARAAPPPPSPAIQPILP